MYELCKITDLIGDYGQGLMLNDRIHSISRLQSALAKAEDYLTKLPSDTSYSEFEYAYALFATPRFLDIFLCIYL